MSNTPDKGHIKLMYDHNLSVEAHTHNFLELVYVTQGRAIHYVDGREMIIKKGNYFIIDYFVSHSYTSIDSKPLEIFNCLFNPEFIDKSLKYCRSFNTLLNHYIIKMDSTKLSLNPSNTLFFDSSGQIYNYMESMYNEYIAQRTGYYELIRCKLISLLIATMRTIEKNDIIDDDPISYIIKYTQENYMKKITLGNIAANLQYSLPYISNRFKKDTGMCFSDYLKQLRVDEACRLLSNTKQTVEDIAESVGYSDIDFFYSVFKKLTGKTPGQFRTIYK